MNKLQILALIALVFCLSSCGAPAANDAGTRSAQRGGTLVYRQSTAPSSFNYLMATDESTVTTAFYLLSSRLVDFDHKAQKYVPALAESWKVEDDGKTVDVKLRDGAKFSDGSEITSDDVVFTMNAIYDEKTNSPAWKGAMTIGDDGRITTTAVDKLNLKLVFPQKVAAVENYMINIGVLSAKALKPVLDAGKLAEAWKVDTDPKQIVSSGPFVVESAAVGESVTLVRNPNYWKKDASGTQLPYLDKLVISVVADPNAAIAKLKQGELDIVDRIRPADFASLKEPNSSVKAVDVGPGMSTDHVFFNLNPATGAGVDRSKTPKFEWFSDKRFRQAVSMAIDRETIANTTLRGLATPMYGFVSPGNKAWGADLPKTPYDLEAAAKLLADAGFSRTGAADAAVLTDAKGNKVEFTLIVPQENEPRKLEAAVIQQDLAKLGISMQIAPIEFKAITEKWSKSFDYDAIMLGLSVSDTEPSSNASFLKSNGAMHQWHPKEKTPATDWEARIDTLFDQQAQESDVQQRRAEFKEIQEIIADQLPVIPIVARHVASAASERVGGLSPSSMLPYSLWNADELFVTK